MPAAVEALAVVLEGELPIAVLEDVDLPRDLGVRQVVRCEVRLHPPGHLVEVIRRLVGEADEDQPGERPDVNALESALLGGSLARRAATDDLAVEVVGPAVIGTLQRRAGNACVLLQDARAAMPAGVVEGGDRAIVAAQEKYRPGADLEGPVVAALRDFGLRGDEQPMPAEDLVD